jgi:RNase H-fold protein (predicted Holliday junction resolvase)
MNSSPNIILAIDPGKREIGLAVFVGVDLVYFSVKTIRNRKSNKLIFSDITEILQSHFESFSTEIVVIKAISQYQKLSPDLEKVVKHIKLKSRQNGLQVVEITLEQIKSVLSKGKKTTQKKAFKTLLVSYPELKRYWNRPNKWQNDYYAFLFSAVAVGAVYLKILSEGD